MEEPKPAQTTAPIVPPPQPAAPPPPCPPANKKRPLENNAHIENSNYFKMRAVLKGLRPHFIEVLQTPDFQNCKAAYVIQEQMKLLMDLYKGMTAETITLEKKNVPGYQPLSSEMQGGQKPGEWHRDVVNPAELPPPDRVFMKPPEDKSVPSGHMAEKQRSEDFRVQGTYVVGGSAFGWNFITFPGNKAVYYGRTKEAFRSANVISH